MRKILIFLMVCISAFSLAACFDKGNDSSMNSGSESVTDSEMSGNNGNTSEDGGEVENVYKITFVQEGQENVVKTVKVGETLTDVPTPVAIPGYDVVWDTTDFSSVTGNATVTAVATKKTFTVKFSLGPAAKETGATISKTTQEVLYQDTFEFPEVACPGYDFVGWVLSDTEESVTSNAYNYTENVVLVAMWEIDVEDPFWWSPEV